MKYLSIVLCFLILSTGLAQKSKVKSKEQPLRSVNGEVFILTKGGNVVKLPIVTINFLPPEQYNAAIDINSIYYRTAIDYLNQKDSIAACKKINDQYGMAIAYARNDSYQKDRVNELIEEQKRELQKVGLRQKFSADPRASQIAIQLSINDKKKDVITCITNSDGKFAVKLKNKKYIVSAYAAREVGKQLSQYNWIEQENYNWTLEYMPEDQPLILSNNNLSE